MYHSHEASMRTRASNRGQLKQFEDFISLQREQAAAGLKGESDEYKQWAIEARVWNKFFYADGEFRGIAPPRMNRPLLAMSKEAASLQSSPTSNQEQVRATLNPLANKEGTHTSSTIPTSNNPIDSFRSDGTTIIQIEDSDTKPSVNFITSCVQKLVGKVASKEVTPKKVNGNRAAAEQAAMAEGPLRMVFDSKTGEVISLGEFEMRTIYRTMKTSDEEKKRLKREALRFNHGN